MLMPRLIFVSYFPATPVTRLYALLEAWWWHICAEDTTALLPKATRLFAYLPATRLYAGLEAWWGLIGALGLPATPTPNTLIFTECPLAREALSSLEADGSMQEADNSLVR
jgi:hypothetical protein